MSPRLLKTLLLASMWIPAAAVLAQPSGPPSDIVLADPDRFPPLTEPPCSYCSTQHLKSLIQPDDRVIAWLRASHNGGAVPLRHFLAAPRVINDTYGLFFYDPDGGYVAAFEKDYGYRLYGWRKGVMVVQGKDGTLWSALSGRAIYGPRQGERLRRIPSLLTTWSHWMMLHPESTAYDLFDGQRYPPTPLPAEMDEKARRSMQPTDPRLPPLAEVLGVEIEGRTKAYPLHPTVDRQCIQDAINGHSLAVFWHAASRTAVAYRTRLEDRELTFYADEISPPSAPFKDRETGTRWTLAGRAVDGPLRGRQLEWVDGVQCRWYAWSAEFPETELHQVDAANARRPPLQGVLLGADQASQEAARQAADEGYNTVVLDLGSAADPDEVGAAVQRIRQAGLAAGYWLEIARCPELAEAHPEWMASLQGHSQWRRLFPAAPRPADGQVIKAYPWVPVLYREAFAAHLRRVRETLQRLPSADVVLLNDLQGGPSACGCGNTLCRWTADYGEVVTAAPYPGSAAADFADQVAGLAPRSEIIPVWLTECEEHDGDPHGACAGVGCYRGKCWPAYAEQLEPLLRDRRRVGVLLAYKELQRDLPAFDQPAGWIAAALDSFERLPPEKTRSLASAERLIAVLQGWDVSPAELEQQLAQVRRSGASSYLVARRRIDQQWSPRLFTVPPDDRAASPREGGN